MIGLDTSAIIDFFNDDKEAIRVIEEAQEPLASTIVNYLEIYFGLDSENKNHQLEAQDYDRFFDTIITLNLTKDTSKRVSKIYWELKRKGKINDKFDCIIAAAFLANGINKIITKNKKHFEHIGGIQVISY